METSSEDVAIFVVGNDQQGTWRLTADRQRLARVHPYFQALLLGPLANSNDTILVPDVDKRAFDHILRYLLDENPKLMSVSTARNTLEAAHRYVIPDLVRDCVSYLDLHLDADNVLEVFRDLRFYCNTAKLAGYGEQVKLTDSESDPALLMGDHCSALLHNCLLVIDEHAETILQQERIEELSFTDLEIITGRPCLRLASETTLFDAMHRWSLSECRRRKTDSTAASRRRVLGDVSYRVRYLLMTEKEFKEGPQKSELLDPVECELVLARLRGEALPDPLDARQCDMLTLFASPRPLPTSRPVYLSARTQPQTDEQMQNGKNDKLLEKHKKKKHKKRGNKNKKERDSDDEKEGRCCSCFGDCLLDTVMCLFD
ncbi:BTB/POZ domain-containing protein 6-B-like [Ctenocephalides felis]|uniref:BTB/POZ domain-containing protein 6-B-like n=1 Tax=Ctenocephalides felis TaxID=7515 RepID=UPI000E6E456B|nr:BTB/POZ domain-containing protein 6-B-like [Ctenocephalides felis]